MVLTWHAPSRRVSRDAIQEIPRDTARRREIPRSAASPPPPFPSPFAKSTQPDTPRHVRSSPAAFDRSRGGSSSTPRKPRRHLPLATGHWRAAQPRPLANGQWPVATPSSLVKEPGAKAAPPAPSRGPCIIPNVPSVATKIRRPAGKCRPGGDLRRYFFHPGAKNRPRVRRASKMEDRRQRIENSAARPPGQGNCNPTGLVASKGRRRPHARHATGASCGLSTEP